MSPDNHIQALRTRHQELDVLLAAQRKRPSPDTAEEARLKALKLRVKDQIARLQGERAAA